MGKSFACHQLAANAKGEYFLFTDADTRHAPECLSAALAAMERTRADLLTVMPEEEMGSRGEKLVIPLLHFILFAFLPLPLVHASRKKLFAMGNGQFLLFRRAAYEAIGGHTAVRDALVEDIGLGRRIKERGFRLRIADGSAIVRCRMYRDFRGVWEGFSKNLYAGFDYSFPAIAGVMAVQIAAFILPLPLLVAGFLSRSASAWPWALPALQLALALLMRIVLSFRFRLDRGYALLHVVSEILLVALSVNSVRWILSGGGARWKGRRYDFRRSAGRLDPSTRNDDWRS
jgi:chlorobactene glucosyltransferase